MLKPTDRSILENILQAMPKTSWSSNTTLKSLSGEVFDHIRDNEQANNALDNIEDMVRGEVDWDTTIGELLAK